MTTMMNKRPFLESPKAKLRHQDSNKQQKIARDTTKRQHAPRRI